MPATPSPRLPCPIRRSSARRGCATLRPTYGRVSRYGAMALSWTMDKIGPMCRSAEDCGLVLKVISGKDSKDPGSAGKSFYCPIEYRRPRAELRMGYHPVDFEDRAAEVARRAFREALEVFRKLGPRLVEIALPRMPYREVAETVIRAEGSAVFEPLIRSSAFDQMPDERQKAGLRAGLDTPARDYLQAMRIRRLMQEEMRKLFGNVDLILSPATAGPASGIEEALDRRRTPGEKLEERGITDIAAGGNLAGLPAVSVPCGLVDRTLPVGLQLTGRMFDESTLLRIADAYERLTEWHTRTPPEG